MARVSSDEQASGYSLDIQMNKLLSYCQNENLNVLLTFKEDYSAKHFNRPEFNKILQYVRKNKGKVEYILVTTWDRFSRNFVEVIAMIKKLKNYGSMVQAIEQPIDISIPENLLLQAMYLALPDIDNKRRSLKITEGVRAAKKQEDGWGPHHLAISQKEKKEGNPIIVPGLKAKIVKDVFDKISKVIVRLKFGKSGKRRNIFFQDGSVSILNLILIMQC